MSGKRLTDDELIALIDEEADDALLAMVAGDASLQAQLATARQFEEQLKHLLHDERHVNQEMLADYVVGLLDEQETTRVEEALKRSPVLRYELQRLQRVMTSGDVTPSPRQTKPQESKIIYFPDMDHLQLAKVRGERPRLVLSPSSKPLPVPLDETGNNILFLALETTDSGELALTGQMVIAGNSGHWDETAVFLYQQENVKSSFIIKPSERFQQVVSHRSAITLHLAPATGRLVVIDSIEIEG